MKTIDDALRLVQNELTSIRNRDGVLDKTPYVVLEIVSRLKNIEWDTRDKRKSLAICIRELVEACIKDPRLGSKKVSSLKTIYEDAEAFDDMAPDPALMVDWDSKGSVTRYANELRASKKNLVKSNRREKKLRRTG